MKTKPVYYPIEEVYKLLDESYTFKSSPRYHGMITYLKRKQTKNKTPH